MNIRKVLAATLAVLAVFALASCGKFNTENSAVKSLLGENTANAPTDVAEDPAEWEEPEDEEYEIPVYTAENIDIDLTKMSSTMVYSEIYNMMYMPDSYVGKVIKVSGDFTVYENGYTERVYPAVYVADAAACCGNGLEFVLVGPEYPRGYPRRKTPITVIGRFELYTEENDGYVGTFCHLVSAVLTE